MRRQLLLIAGLLSIAGCSDTYHQSSVGIEQQKQEALAKQSEMAAGMPAIKNFFMKKELKQIQEMCDDPEFATYTYIVAEMTGKLIYIGQSVGYGIPASTQYTNPQQIIDGSGGGNYWHDVLPQPDPDGLFSPSSAEGTWVLLKDPGGKDVKPVYIEPRIVVSPFPLGTFGK